MIQDLYQIKEQILKEVHSFLNGNNFPLLTQYHTLVFKIPTIDFKEIIPLGQMYPKVLFSNREGTYSCLGLGKTNIFHKESDLEKIESLIKEFKDLTVIGGHRFFTKQVPSKEWAPFGEAFFIIPLLSFERKNNQYLLKVHLKKEHGKEILMQIEKALDLRKSIREGLFKENKLHILNSPEQYPWEKAVDKCIDHLEDINEKVVLSRKSIHSYQEEIDAPLLFNTIEKKMNNSFHFFMSLEKGLSFISFTPERLFKIEHKKIVSDVLAGTTLRGQTKEEDQLLAHELQQNQKEINEHKIVKEEIQKVLTPLCDNLKVAKNEEIYKLPIIQHIYSLITGQLKKETTIQKLLKDLHPTPAVGGRPKKKAFDLINLFEDHDRGFYGAPLGVISSSYTDFAVGIRSALVVKREMHVYGGSGIVKGSEGFKEWIETDNKMKNFQLSN